MWADINQWRRPYDPNYGIMAPHITVAYPPFVPEEHWTAMRLAVRQCLSQSGPFRILLRGLGAFEGDHHVLWLRVEDGGQLSRIRAALMHCLPERVPPLPFEYVPHVTLGVFESRAELNQAEEAMRVQMKPRRFTVHRLTYLSPDEQGVWSVCSHVPLGTGIEK
jgi:2'-5' RNA ligase